MLTTNWNTMTKELLIFLLHQKVKYSQLYKILKYVAGHWCVSLNYIPEDFQISYKNYTVER